MTKKGQKLVWHGLSRTRAASAWYAMWRRVNGVTEAYQRQYKNRGITACDRWKSLALFIEDMGECPAGMTLDRIDNSRGYEPGNCRWATKKEQGRNRGNSRRWCIDGVTYETAREAGAALGVSESTIRRWCGAIKCATTRRDCQALPVYSQKTLPVPEHATN